MEEAGCYILGEVYGTLSTQAGQWLATAPTITAELDDIEGRKSFIKDLLLIHFCYWLNLAFNDEM
jgi:hypothetical protein